MAVIGMDFLNFHKLWIDAGTRQLVQSPVALENPPVSLGNSSVEMICSAENTLWFEGFARIKEAYPEVFNTDNYKAPVRHETRHFIPTYGTPICGRVRRLSPEKTECLKNELQHLLELDIIAPANSPYGSPVQMVPKENGKFRITGDYRMLNQQTQKSSYRIPFLHDYIDRLSGSKIFSKVDLFKSYHPIPIADCNIHKTAILTPCGTYHGLF